MHNSSACAVVTSVDDPLDISSSRPHSQARPDGVRATKQRLLESWGNRYRRRHQISLSVLDRSNWREGGREGRLHAGGLNVIVLVKFYCPHPHTARQMYVPRAPHTAPVRSLHHHVLSSHLGSTISWSSGICGLSLIASQLLALLTHSHTTHPRWHVVSQPSTMRIASEQIRLGLISIWELGTSFGVREQVLGGHRWLWWMSKSFVGFGFMSAITMLAVRLKHFCYGRTYWRFPELKIILKDQRHKMFIDNNHFGKNFKRFRWHKS